MQELKEECQKLGLPTTGKKAELIDRILAASGAAEAAAPAVDAAPAPAAAAAAEPDAPAPAAEAPAAENDAGANNGTHVSGKHQRIEFNLDSAAAAPEAGGEPAHKIIKLSSEDMVGLRRDDWLRLHMGGPLMRAVESTRSLLALQGFINVPPMSATQAHAS